MAGSRSERSAQPRSRGALGASKGPLRTQPATMAAEVSAPRLVAPITTCQRSAAARPAPATPRRPSGNGAGDHSRARDGPTAAALNQVLIAPTCATAMAASAAQRPAGRASTAVISPRGELPPLPPGCALSGRLVNGLTG